MCCQVTELTDAWQGEQKCHDVGPSDVKLLRVKCFVCTNEETTH